MNTRGGIQIHTCAPSLCTYIFPHASVCLCGIEKRNLNNINIFTQSLSCNYCCSYQVSTEIILQLIKVLANNKNLGPGVSDHKQQSTYHIKPIKLVLLKWTNFFKSSSMRSNYFNLSCLLRNYNVRNFSFS